MELPFNIQEAPMAKVTTFCWWCHTAIKMPQGFNEKKSKPMCSVGCRDAEMLFNIHFSDEEINRKWHYDEITKGTDND
jgi:hypothetical protein